VDGLSWAHAKYRTPRLTKDAGSSWNESQPVLNRCGALHAHVVGLAQVLRIQYNRWLNVAVFGDAEKYMYQAPS
jgi:hypothetical protein